MHTLDKIQLKMVQISNVIQVKVIKLIKLKLFSFQLITFQRFAEYFRPSGHLFQAMRYLTFVDFFKDNDPLKQTSVAPIFDDFKRYDKFMDNVVNKETRVKADYEFALKLYNRSKTYLNRAVESGILIWGEQENQAIS